LSSLSVTGNITGGNVSATNLTGSLVTAAQANITSVGTLSSLSVTGNITGGNVLGGANVNATTHTGTTVSVTGNITGGNVSATNLAGSLTTAAQANITSVGTLSVLSVSGNITSSAGNLSMGNVLTGGLISATGNITGGNVLVAGAGGNITGANIIAATTLSATGNITGGNIITAGTGGNISGANIITATTLSATGNIIGGNITTAGILTVNSGNALTAIVNGGGNLVGNIGSTTGYFNTIFAKATSAQYADLAEMYTSDLQYLPGTVVVFGGEQEVTSSTVGHDSRVAGVVSTNPAHIMNSGITGDCSIAVALTGRVPCQVVGTVTKGDQMVTSNIAGVAERLDISQYQPGVVIGKSLEDHSGSGVGIIEIVVGRV